MTPTDHVQTKSYNLISLPGDGYGVKVVKRDGTTTVTDFRTLEEAEAWIDRQKRRDEEGELSI
jgi:hypothetical protein